jgi:hypothetical protein
VHPGHELSTHYLSCSGEPSVVYKKSVPRYVTLNLCFCISWDLWVRLCIPVRPSHETSMHYFHAWLESVRIRQKRARTRYAELAFLHSVGYAGHIVHSGVSRA